MVESLISNQLSFFSIPACSKHIIQITVAASKHQSGFGEQLNLYLLEDQDKILVCGESRVNSTELSFGKVVLMSVVL